MLSYENKTKNEAVLIALVVSVVITNVFIISSPDENTRFYYAGLTSTLSIGVALVICVIQVYRYKRRVRINASVRLNNRESPYYYDNDKMHLSICLFLGLWFVAQFVWTFPYQQTAGVWIVDIIVSILRLLSTQPVDFSILLVTLVYPVLDAALVFPAVLIFWGARKRIAALKHAAVQQERKTDETIQREAGRSSSSLSQSLTNISSIWILLLSIAMILSAIGDTGFAFSTAYGPESVQRDVWIWNIIYNADHLCLAAALIGYGSFFSFRKQDKRSDSKRI